MRLAGFGCCFCGRLRRKPISVCSWEPNRCQPITRTFRKNVIPAFGLRIRSSVAKTEVQPKQGKRLQPFWIEDEARKIANTNFVVAGRFKAHAVRDANLITGQQQSSATAMARPVIEAVAGDAVNRAAAVNKAG